MNVFVIFALGLGGNHLSNMIATDSKFHSRSTLEKYKNSKKYAHHSNHLNLTNLQLSDYNNNVMCGHFGQFCWLDKNLFENKQVVIVEMPTDMESYAFKRFMKYNKWVNLEGRHEYFYQEQRTLYTPEMIERVSGITDFWTISAESIVSKQSPVNLLSDMNYNIDKELCEKMHTEWIKKNLEID